MNEARAKKVDAVVKAHFGTIRDISTIPDGEDRIIAYITRLFPEPLSREQILNRTQSSEQDFQKLIDDGVLEPVYIVRYKLSSSFVG